MAERPGMSRRVVLRGLLLGGGAAGLAACGVPSASKPHIDGDGPSESGQGGGNANMAPPSPVGISRADDFVKKFLTALAAPSDEQSRAAAIANAKTFLTPEAQDDWQADPKMLTIVRVVSVGLPASGSGGTNIDVDLVPVGQLMANGWVNPMPGVQQHATFKLVPDDSAPSSNVAWRIARPLPAVLANSLLLSSEGLSAPQFYPHLIYYWDAANVGLVADLRYLPSVGLKLEQQPTQIVNWLINGPADWLEPAVTPLPTGTSLVLPNVAHDTSNHWVVDFANLQNVDPARVAAQLQASLLPNFTEPVRLQIASQDKPTDTAKFLTENLADAPARAGDATAYFIANGQVCQTDSPYAVPPVFAKIKDASVVRAAVSRDLNLGAIVHEVKVGGRSQYRLAIGQRSSADAGQGPDFTQVPLAGAAMSRPVWLNLATPRLLVAVDGALYVVNLAHQASRVQVSGQLDGSISAFSVAPDGRRIALIVGGKAAVAPLTFPTDTVVVGPPTFIDAGGLTDLTLTAVAWSRAHYLALAGQTPANRYGLVEVSQDGALSSAINNFTSPVTQLSCYPPLPSRTLSQAGPIMVQTQSKDSWAVTRDGVIPLSFTPAQPSPSTTGTPPPASPNTLLAPFFAD